MQECVAVNGHLGAGTKFRVAQVALSIATGGTAVSITLFGRLRPVIDQFVEGYTRR